MHGSRIPLWVKLVYSLFMCVLVPVYWHQHGAANFLWASDVALFVVLGALWSESALLNSMMAIGVLPFEIVWIADFVTGSRLVGAASYMFDAERPLYLRALSLFHVALPAVMIFLLHRLGYDRRALAAQTLFTWVVLLVTYLFTDPAANINLVFGPGRKPQTAIPPLAYLALEMVLVPALVCWPTHHVLRRLLIG